MALPALRHGGAFLIPAWVTVVVIARDVLLVVMALVAILTMGLLDVWRANRLFDRHPSQPA